MSVEVTHEHIAKTGHLLAREIAWNAIERACELPPSDPPGDGVRLAPLWPERMPILDRRPLENEVDVILELISDHSSVDGPHELHRPERVGSRCFLANRRITTRSALISLRERLIQMSALNKATQLRLGAPNTEAGNLNALNADLAHEMSTLLTVLEVALHEEHFFQLLTMEGTEH